MRSAARQEAAAATAQYPHQAQSLGHNQWQLDLNPVGCTEYCEKFIFYLTSFRGKKLPPGEIWIQRCRDEQGERRRSDLGCFGLIGIWSLDEP
jgi:hypothetical protein